MIWGCKVTVRTGHKALIWLKSVRESDKMLNRWYFLLSEALELDFDVGDTLESVRWQVEHSTGEMHENADSLSRRTGGTKWNQQSDADLDMESSGEVPRLRVNRVRRGHEECPSCSTAAAAPLVASMKFADGFKGIAKWQDEEPGWTNII